MRISVLGLGHWGTAIASHLAGKGFEVLGWSIEPEVVEGINRAHRNPKYLSQVELAAGLRATADLERTAGHDYMILVLPSEVLSRVLPKVPVRADTIFVSAVKGIDYESVLTPLECAQRFLPVLPELAVISGPGFAKDVAAGRVVGLVAASQREETARKVADLFSNEGMRVYTSTDPLGVELGGILKNVIAIAAGAVDGLELGDSARAGLITRGLAEMTRLACAMGADARTLSGLSGLGDLVLTCTCDNSRNRTVGFRLAKGESLNEIISSLGSVAEGVKNSASVLKLAEKYGVDMPISVQVDRILRGEVSPQQSLRALVSRPLKKELE